MLHFYFEWFENITDRFISLRINYQIIVKLYYVSTTSRNGKLVNVWKRNLKSLKVISISLDFFKNRLGFFISSDYFYILFTEPRTATSEDR